MQLVIVESPAKAKTIEKYLGPGHRVLASYGHVRDLPPKDGSVDPDDQFAMTWENYADKSKQLKAITDLAKTADRLILATDPDREGEAISWHVREVLRARPRLALVPAALAPVAGEERLQFIRQAEIDYMDFAIIGDAEGSLEDGILTLRVDLRPPEKRGTPPKS